MSEQQLGIAERMVEIVRGLTLQNVLTIALLIVVAIPSWFAWRFIQDEEFRHEFLSNTKTLDANVPCLVVVSNLIGQTDRYTIASAYDLQGRMEQLIAFRSAGPLSDGEVASTCVLVNEHVELMRDAISGKKRADQEARGLKP